MLAESPRQQVNAHVRRQNFGTLYRCTLLTFSASVDVVLQANLPYLHAATNKATILTAYNKLFAQKDHQKSKTYNSQDSYVVTHHTTNWPACGLCAVNSRVGAARVSLG